MSLESVAITTSEDLFSALDYFTKTSLKPLFGQLCQEMQTRVQRDIQAEFQEIKLVLQELQAVRAHSKDSLSVVSPHTSEGQEATKKSSTSNVVVPLPAPPPPTVEVFNVDSDSSHPSTACPIINISEMEVLPSPDCKQFLEPSDFTEANHQENQHSDQSDTRDKSISTVAHAGGQGVKRSSLVACVQCGNRFNADLSACHKCGTRRRRETFANIVPRESFRRVSQAKPGLRRSCTESNFNEPGQQIPTGLLQPDKPCLKRQGTQTTMKSVGLSSYANSINSREFLSKTPVPEDVQSIPLSHDVFMTRRRCVLRDSMESQISRKQLEELILKDLKDTHGSHPRDAIMPLDPQDSHGVPSVRSSVTSQSDATKHSTRSASKMSSKFSFLLTTNLQKRCLLSVKALVLSSEFDYCAGVAIVLNAIMLGVQTDYMARYFTDEVPVAFQVLEKCFAVVFTVELLLRLFTFRGRFFHMHGWKWNVFDIVVVGIQLIEEFMSLFAPSSSGSGNKFGVLRMLRVLRLVRIIRLVRVLRLIGELRTIVVSIMGCMRSLFWTMLLLLLMIYMIGVYLTQLVSDHKVQNRRLYLQSQESLEEYFGSLGSSILTLFATITGGINWDQPCLSLMDHISPWLVFVFAAYVCFSLLAMMNVVTGVFVESALENAKRDKDLYLLQHVRKLFKDVDQDGNGTVSWSEFENQLGNPNMKVYFDACDLDLHEAENLFVLLDVDESGFIDADEFVNNFFKLRGTAKAIDLAMLSHGFERLGRKFKVVEDTLKEMKTTLRTSERTTNNLKDMKDFLDAAAFEDDETFTESTS